MHKTLEHYYHLINIEFNFEIVCLISVNSVVDLKKYLFYEHV